MQNDGINLPVRSMPRQIRCRVYIEFHPNLTTVVSRAEREQ